MSAHGAENCKIVEQTFTMITAALFHQYINGDVNGAQVEELILYS